MKRAFRLVVILMVVTAAGQAAAQEKKVATAPAVPAGSEKMRILVELTGLLKVKKSGSTLTFTRYDHNDDGDLSFQKVVWEVDLSRSAALRKKAAALDGKEVVVEGTACVWIKECLRYPTPPVPNPPTPRVPTPPTPGGPYVVSPPPRAERAYRLETQRVVKVTALRAREE